MTMMMRMMNDVQMVWYVCFFRYPYPDEMRPWNILNHSSDFSFFSLQNLILKLHFSVKSFLLFSISHKTSTKKTKSKRKLSSAKSCKDLHRISFPFLYTKITFLSVTFEVEENRERKMYIWTKAKIISSCLHQ